MTDIYRKELDIPEKPKSFGWLFLAIGGLMMFFALWTFRDEASELKKYQTPPAPVESKIETALGAEEIQIDPVQLSRARQMFWIMILVLILTLAFFVIVTVSHRIALHLKKQAAFRPKKTEFVDPWKQSAERIQVDPPDQEDR